MLSEPRLTIAVHKGPSAGTELVLAEGTLTIGRDPNSDLVLSGDEFVSSRHATVTSSDRVAILRNESQNGTLVNGKPVTTTQLTVGDNISIGLLHLLGVRAAVQVAAPAPRKQPVGVPRAAVAPPPAPVAATAVPPVVEQPAATRGFRMPAWLMVYLVLMAIAFVAFGVMRMSSSNELGLAEIQAQERQYATAHGLASADTDRVLRLLETAAVHERRGDRRSAYESYRETLGARQPIDPQSPAYRYAAAQMAALGPK